MDYTYNKASSFDYMNSTTDLFKTNDLIYMPCHSSNSSSSSIFAHDLIHGHSTDDYFNLNYDNGGDYNSDLLLFDSNDGANIHMNQIDQGISIEMIKNERDFNFVFENLFDTNNGFGSTPLSNSQSISDSMSMSSSFTTLNPVSNNPMSSLLLSPTSMIESHPTDEIVSSPAPFESDKESLRLPCFLVTNRTEQSQVDEANTANQEAQFLVNEKPTDTRRTRAMPIRDQVTGRFKNSSSSSAPCDMITVVDSKGSLMLAGSVTNIGEATGLSKTAASSASRKSTKRSRSLVNNPNRRKRTKFSHEQIEILEKCFTRDTKYPDSSVIEHLAYRTHLDFHTITIWFQNRRSKDKKMKKN